MLVLECVEKDITEVFRSLGYDYHFNIDDISNRGTAKGKDLAFALDMPSITSTDQQNYIVNELSYNVALVGFFGDNDKRINKLKYQLYNDYQRASLLFREKTDKKQFINDQVISASIALLNKDTLRLNTGLITLNLQVNVVLAFKL